MDKRSKIAVLGFGVEGKAALEWLVKHQYNEVTVCDQNVDLEAELPDGVSCRLGEDYLADLSDFEVIFRSPGISILRPEIEAARLAGAEITSATNYFMDQCPGKVIGVSGTKGKGTTSTLIYELLKKSGLEAGKNLFLGGNIGKCAMDFFDDVKGDGVVVLELSSFQLHDLSKAPHYAVLLNTTEDHLDYHADREEYMEAKERLLSLQHPDAVAVLNKDYPYYSYYRELVKGELLEVSTRGAVEDGAFVEDGAVWVTRMGEKMKVLPVSEVGLIGAHNLENIVAALAVAREFMVSVRNMAEVVREFKNLPYRLQFVRELKGVSFYNDSYSTTPDTSMAAVDSFAADTVLIAGGRDKGSSYAEWAERILTRENLHTVVLIGECAEMMEKELMLAEERLGAGVGSPTKILRRGTMEQAVLDAYAEADEGGVVVMSPGATSLDMYANYKERGNDFIAQVRKLK